MMKEEEEAKRPEYTPITGRIPVTVLPVCALQGLSLIQNQVLPLDTIEVLEVCNNQLVTCNHNVKTCFPCVQVLLVPKLTQDFAFLLVKWVPIRSVSQCKFHISTSSGFKWPWNGSNICLEMLVSISQTINVTMHMTKICTLTTLKTWKFIQESFYSCAFFWVIPWHLNFICRCFETLCLFHLHRRIGMKDDSVWKCWIIYRGNGLARAKPFPL